jgi:hypothetical protein
VIAVTGVLVIGGGAAIAIGHWFSDQPITRITGSPDL